MCYASGGVYDMSGNVSEWTSSQAMYNGASYYKVRGGAFNTMSGGTRCAFDFVIQTPSYEYNDLGFRCCADAAP